MSAAFHIVQQFVLCPQIQNLQYQLSHYRKYLVTDHRSSFFFHLIHLHTTFPVRPQVLVILYIYFHLLLNSFLLGSDRFTLILQR